ncbi:hypothetical protein [Paraburkholderia caffeinilytica]|uniref:hypothetical protein n=1 Tax=Paraburkholderia caffeinilytica TaxID=1761016 RepID=UPI003DA0FF71
MAITTASMLDELLARMKPHRQYRFYEIKALLNAGTSSAQELLRLALSRQLITCRTKNNRNVYWLVCTNDSLPKVHPGPAYKQGELTAAHTQWAQFRALCEVTRPDGRATEKEHLHTQGTING